MTSQDPAPLKAALEDALAAASGEGLERIDPYDQVIDRAIAVVAGATRLKPTRRHFKVAIGQHVGIEPHEVLPIAYKAVDLFDNARQPHTDPALLTRLAADLYVKGRGEREAKERAIADRETRKQAPPEPGSTTKRCAGRCGQTFERSQLISGRCEPCYERWETAVLAHHEQSQVDEWGPKDDLGRHKAALYVRDERGFWHEPPGGVELVDTEHGKRWVAKGQFQAKKENAA